jgi:hypothetical protein
MRRVQYSKNTLIAVFETAEVITNLPDAKILATISCPINVSFQIAGSANSGF